MNIQKSRIMVLILNKVCYNVLSNADAVWALRE